MADVSEIIRSGSARSIGAAIAAGQTTSREVTQWYLDRIGMLNGGKDGLNCVRTISPLALEQAGIADTELAAGRSRGPLHGVPYLVKDNIFTTDGSFTSAGCRALSGFVPPYEATLVRRLRAAGAVLLGKTNLTEFADFVSDTMPAEFSGAGGVVRNPVGSRYGRGLGSSVGSAAAVAAKMCAFAIGTETQNSIQTPAVHSAVVGFKPTVGRVGRHGIVPLVPSQDSPGPITLTVEDADLVFDAIAGADLNDTATLASADVPTASRVMIQGLRIGIPRNCIADNVLTENNRPAFMRALALLGQAGAIIVDPCDLPYAEELSTVRSSVFRTEFKESLNTLLGSLQPCGMASMDDIIAYNRNHPEAIPYGQSLLEASNASEDIFSAEYIKDRRRDIALSLGGIRAALGAGKVDVLMAPMSAAARWTGKSGAPVVAIPAGQDGSGMPFGITLFCAPGSDGALLQAALAVESVLNSDPWQF